MADLAELAPHISAACAAWGVDGDHILLAHGSRVEGFANGSSDVDFWVISPRGATPPLLPVFDWIGGYRMQPESLSYETIAALADRINALIVDRAQDVLSITSHDLDVYYRIGTSIPLSNDSRAEGLKQAFHRDHAASLFARRCGIAASTELRKAAVYRTARDRLEESLCLTRAVEWALDSYLASNGEAYPNRKWRFEKLGRRFGVTAPLYRRAWRLKAPPPLRSLTSYRRECHELIESLGVLDEPQKVAPRHLRRGDIVRIGGQSFLVIPHTAVYLLEAHGATLWELVNGENTCEDLIDRLARGDYAHGRPADLVFQWLAVCRSHGLVDLQPIDDL